MLSVNILKTLSTRGFRAMSTSSGGNIGSGAGRGGGAGGTIREAGGAFGEREAAQEEMYFRKLQHEQIAKLKQHLDEEVEFHESQIKTHQDAINRHKNRIEELHEKKAEH